MAGHPSRHEIMPNGITVPARSPCGVVQDQDRDQARRVLVPRMMLDRQHRRALGAWLVARLGRPDRVAGAWWSDDLPEGLAITMRDDAVFVEFALTWCY